MKVLVLPGDGIGPEITEQAVRVLNVINDKYNLGIETETALIGGIAYDKTGKPLPDETLEKALAADAVILGAVGDTKYDNLPREVRPEQGLLAIRKALNLLLIFALLMYLKN